MCPLDYNLKSGTEAHLGGSEGAAAPLGFKEYWQGNSAGESPPHSIITNSELSTSVKSFSSSPNFYIQDPLEEIWGGVYVYVGDSDALNVGDEVEFSAEVVEYYGVTELSNVQNLQVLSSNNVINPVSINTGNLGLSCGDGEAYEGMFVEFTNVTIESINTEYNSIYINDGSGTAKLDDYYFNFDAGFWPNLSVGRR